MPTGAELTWVDYVMASATVLAALATSVAAIASARSSKAARRSADHTRDIAQRDQERRDEERDRALEAQVTGMYVVAEDVSWLQIENRGPAVAANVRIEVTDAPRGLQVEDAPAELLPGVPIVLPHDRVWQGDAKATTIVRWTDGRGVAREVTVHPTPVPLVVAKDAREQARAIGQAIAWDMTGL